MTVVMMEQMNLDNSVEKSEKKNDQDLVDGMRQEVYYVIVFYTVYMSVLVGCTVS